MRLYPHNHPSVDQPHTVAIDTITLHGMSGAPIGATICCELSMLWTSSILEFNSQRMRSKRGASQLVEFGVHSFL